MMSSTMLNVEKLTVQYGRLTVIRDMNLSVAEGEITALVGANGAGKSSVINAVCGVLPGAAGTVEFLGERIDGLKPHERVGRGLVQIPEGRLLFGSLTVLENLELGANSERARASIREGLEYVFALFPRLRQRRSQIARTLSGGEQQMLAIGRGLMSRPRMLIMDEPSWGLAPKLVSEVLEAVKKINAEGVTVLLVEQHIQQCLRVADRAYVIENGSIVMEGSGAGVLADEHVRKAYLGL